MVIIEAVVSNMFIADDGDHSLGLHFYWNIPIKLDYHIFFFLLLEFHNSFSVSINFDISFKFHDGSYMT